MEWLQAIDDRPQPTLLGFCVAGWITYYFLLALNRSQDLKFSMVIANIMPYSLLLSTLYQ